MAEFINIQVEEAPAGFTDQEWSDIVLDYLYAGTDELGLLINAKVEQRTPIRTGALELGETFTPNHNKSDDTLVDFSPTDQTQIDEWGRIYAQYIEGIASSPTIRNPSEMYARAETEDIGDIEAWAAMALQGGANSVFGGGTP